MTQQWKLVPVEPTDEQVKACSHDDHGGLVTAWYRRAIYAAMLAAAPTPPASAQDDAKDDLTLAQKYEDACILANANARDASRWRKAVSLWRVKRIEVFDGVHLSHPSGIPWDDLLRQVDAALASSVMQAPVDGPEDLLHRLANPLTPYGLLARALRVATGTTLMDMARASGNTAAEISSIEFGRTEPDEGWFERAAMFFASNGVVVPPSTLKTAHDRRAASQQQEG